MKVKLTITRKVLFEKYSLYEDMKGFFLSFLDGCELKVSENYPDSIFYVKNDKVLFKQDFKYKVFYVSNNLIWSVFKRKYQIEYHKIQALMKGVLETHLKFGGYTFLCGTISINDLTKEHLKPLKFDGYTYGYLGKTYCSLLERHIKTNGITLKL